MALPIRSDSGNLETGTEGGGGAGRVITIHRRLTFNRPGFARVTVVGEAITRA